MTSDILVNGELETSIYQAKTCNSALKTTRSSATWLRNLSFDVRIKDLHALQKGKGYQSSILSILPEIRSIKRWDLSRHIFSSHFAFQI